MPRLVIRPVRSDGDINDFPSEKKLAHLFLPLGGGPVVTMSLAQVPHLRNNLVFPRIFRRRIGVPDWVWIPWLVSRFEEKAEVIADRGISVYVDDQDEMLLDIPEGVTVLKIRNEGNFDFDAKKWLFSERTGRML